MSITKSELLQAVATASAGYFAANPMPLEQAENVIRVLTKALISATGAQLVLVDQTPAVPPDQAVDAGLVTCLECGRSMRSLKSHIRARHGLTPEAYRRKWGLPDTFPMMAPDASALRSVISKKVQVRIQADPTIRKGGRRRPAP